MSEPSENRSELDEYGVWIKTPHEAKGAQADPAEDFSDFSFPGLSLEDSAAEIPEPASEMQDEKTAAQDIEVEDIQPEDAAEATFVDQAEIPAETEAAEEPVPAEETAIAGEIASVFSEPAAEAPDGDIDLSSFMDSGPSQGDGDIDLSAFMGDDSAPSAFGDGDIDLDAFMGGESFAGEKEEQAEIEEADPLDIDLDFEETDVEFQDSGSEGLSDSPQEFEELPPAEEIPEDAFSESFSVQEAPSFSPEPAPSPASSFSDEEIDLSDFGFDDNSDNQNPILGDGKEKKAQAGPVDYEMTVDIEDDSEPEEKTESKPVAEHSGDEDILVDISRDAESAEQKEQETDLSSPDDSFDIDSIFNSIEDESGQPAGFAESAQETAAEEPPHEAETAVQDIDVEDIQPEDAAQADTVDQAEIPEEAEPVTEPEETASEEEPSFQADTVSEDLVTDESDEAIPLDDFMGEEGFTDGGPGVTGPYNEDGTPIQRAEEKESSEPEQEEQAAAAETDGTEEISSCQDETVTEEEPEADFEPPVLPENEEPEADNQAEQDTQELEEIHVLPEEPENQPAETEEALPQPDIFEERTEKKEDIEVDKQEIADVSDYLDEGPDYDMTGVTVSLDELENISDVPPEEAEMPKTIPDTFEEEAASLTEEIQEERKKQTYSVFRRSESSSAGQVDMAESKPESKAENESQQPAAETDSQAETAQENRSTDSILEKIASELSSLKSQINGLKDEFEELKKNGIPAEQAAVPAEEPEEAPHVQEEAEQEPEAVPQELEEAEQDLEANPQALEAPQEAEAAPGDSGFFNSTDDDDTIALSGDELSNILSSAEFTSHDAENLDAPAEEPEEAEQLEEFEEPVIQESSFEEDAPAEEEITVPAAEDNAEAVPEDAAEPVQEEENSGIITDEDIPSPTLESLDLPTIIENEEEPLTEDNIEYLTSEAAPETEEAEEEENLETGISEQPVESVFSNWNASPETEPEETDSVSEPEMQEPAKTEEAAPEEADRSSCIPSDMKAEIKSVLAYMDQLLENLPEEKIAEFAQSEQFETYKKLFAELGLS